MPSSLSSLSSRWASSTGALGFLWRTGPILAVHLAALVTLLQTEYYDVPRISAFVLTWALFNFVWLAVLRRPGVAAVLSLGMIAILIQVSTLKYGIIWQTVNFVDLMVIDAASISYLLAIVPGLTVRVLIVIAAGGLALLLLWRFDTIRVSRLRAITGAFGCLLGLGALSVTHPFWPEDIWYPHSHVSNFARSGVDAVVAYTRGGFMESDDVVTERIKTVPAASCEPTGKPPHIIMIHDESAFDIRRAPNIKVPTGYGQHFRFLTASNATSSSRPPGARVGTPSTMFSQDCRREASASSRIS